MDDIKKINNINKIKQNTINKLTTIIKKSILMFYKAIKPNKTQTQKTNKKLIHWLYTGKKTFIN